MIDESVSESWMASWPRGHQLNINRIEIISYVKWRLWTCIWKWWNRDTEKRGFGGGRASIGRSWTPRTDRPQLGERCKPETMQTSHNTMFKQMRSTLIIPRAFHWYQEFCSSFIHSLANFVPRFEVTFCNCSDIFVSNNKKCNSCKGSDLFRLSNTFLERKHSPYHAYHLICIWIRNVNEKLSVKTYYTTFSPGSPCRSDIEIQFPLLLRRLWHWDRWDLLKKKDNLLALLIDPLTQ